MAGRPPSFRSIQPSSSWNLSVTQDISRFISLVKKHPELIVRISPERLLPEWEKLVPVTGNSASDMATKWKRLCDKYRGELRREISSDQPGEFVSNWPHFEAMAFVRSIEEKRIRLNRGGQTKKPPLINLTEIKLEPGTPPPPKSSKPRVQMVDRTREPNPAGFGMQTNPSVGTSRQSHQVVRKLIPIEKVLDSENAKVRCTKRDIMEDLQVQAGKVVASRKQPIHRIPVTNLPVGSIRDAPDNDYDFLMIRIYPLLAALPLHVKRSFYENTQNFIVKQFRSIDQVRRTACKDRVLSMHNNNSTK